eukprot:CAMPEP_0119342222 /NCGR_PEP_ID=MMETSP1333-20130426/104249_1 /TAXON_ID=418940 /ORGANISM="Scyphosphaera apsteinii, Strain RCC1455" /LENGTH=260 /DNA_ID=CAMNT_0007354391 /DNA_START=29 /DNA_END=811 /DNA_ORIENTATION=+
MAARSRCVQGSTRPPASRHVLADWASQISGSQVTNSLDKHTTTGVLFCQLFEAIKPGSIDMRKMNARAQAESDSIANFKLLQAAFERHKMDHLQGISITSLAKGQPQATLELLQEFHKMHVGETECSSALAPIDGNAVVRIRDPTRKRRGDGLTSQAKRSSAKNAGEAAEAPTAVESLPAETSIANLSLDEVTHGQLEHLRKKVRQAAIELTAMREEKDFYWAKLRCIEEICQKAGGKFSQDILNVLYLAEDEFEEHVGE